jgi:hypothetical protein
MDIVEELNDAQEWMRKPDWESAFTHDDIMRWLNERPTHILPKASAEIARLRSELEAVKREAVEVLKPFAKSASTFSFAIGPDGIDDDMTVIAYAHVRPNSEADLSTRNFSDARAFVEKHGRGG